MASHHGRRIALLLSLLFFVYLGGNTASADEDEITYDLSHLSDTVVTGHVKSFCLTWQLNKLPELKSFLKHGEAECYHNVTVEYKHMTKLEAFLTIKKMQKDYETGGWRRMIEADGTVSQDEIVDLTQYHSKEDLHHLFESKGFTKKSHIEQTIQKLKNLQMRKQEVEEKKQHMIESPLARRKYTEDERMMLIREHDDEIKELELFMDNLVLAEA